MIGITKAKASQKERRSTPFARKTNSRKHTCQYKREEILVIVGGSTYEEDETLLLDSPAATAENGKEDIKEDIEYNCTRKTEHVGSLKRHIEKWVEGSPMVFNSYGYL